MSVDYEGYDPVRVIEEADVRRAEHMDKAKLLDQSVYILELVAKQLSDVTERVEFFHQEAGLITVDSKELMDIVGERANPQEAVERIRLGARVVLLARDTETGRAKAAHDTAEFMQGKLDQDTATEDLGAGVENGGLAGS